MFDPTVAAEIDGVWRERAGVRHRSTTTRRHRIESRSRAARLFSLWWVERVEWEG